MQIIVFRNFYRNTIVENRCFLNFGGVDKGCRAIRDINMTHDTSFPLVLAEVIGNIYTNLFVVNTVPRSRRFLSSPKSLRLSFIKFSHGKMSNWSSTFLCNFRTYSESNLVNKFGAHNF